jgi:hypothetical protein
MDSSADAGVMVVRNICGEGGLKLLGTVPARASSNLDLGPTSLRYRLRF